MATKTRPRNPVVWSHEDGGWVPQKDGKDAPCDAPRLRAFGLCGVDDSVDPRLLYLISKEYPQTEWGVLFRPDKAGEPRYASDKWVRSLSALLESKGRGHMRLAGHLCGTRCTEVLEGNSTFVQGLAKIGFGRVQVNATKANGVDTTALDAYVKTLRKSILAVPEIEWIIQMNDETKPLWEPLLASTPLPTNISVLFDASCGTGVLPSSFEAPRDDVPCGYAGGLGPANIVPVLKKLAKVTGSKLVWTDMESSLREIADGRDVFSITKAFSCLTQTAALAGVQ